MAASEENSYDPNNPVNMFPDAQTGNLPHDRKVILTDDGYLIGNSVSV